MPLPRLRKFGLTRFAASTKAVCIFKTAVVSWLGVGDVKSAAKISPTTWSEAANVPVLMRENPVRELDAAGLTPTLPSRPQTISLRGADM